MQSIEEYLLSMIDSIFIGLVDGLCGLVAQSGRAPGFYSNQVINLDEKKPDGRGFKSLRARLIREVIA